MSYKDIAPQIAIIAKKYDYRQPPDFLIKLQELFDKIWRFVADLLASLKIHVPGVTDSSMMAHFLQFFVIFVGVVSLLAILFYTLRRVAQITAADRKLSRQYAESAIILDYAGWKQEAQQLAAARNWRDACRASYMAGLRLLDEAKIVDFAPARTNYEYWYALAPQSKPLAMAFRKLAQMVEAIWFGNKAAQQADLTECFESLRNLEVEIALLQELKKQPAESMR